MSALLGVGPAARWAYGRDTASWHPRFHGATFYLLTHALVSMVWTSRSDEQEDAAPRFAAALLSKAHSSTVVRCEEEKPNDLHRSYAVADERERLVRHFVCDGCSN